MKIRSVSIFTSTLFSTIILAVLIFTSCGEQANQYKNPDKSTVMEVNNTNTDSLYPELLTYISANTLDFSRIPDERKSILNEMASFIKANNTDHQAVKLTFICTHNSRRSHMSQLWAQAAAAYYGRENIHCFSGGTEATAFNPRAVNAMQNAGFRISKNDETTNPNYQVRFSEKFDALNAFSKKFSDPSNPQEGFIAVMTCSDADAACPFVPGAAARFALPFEDPKASDNSPAEEETYRERCNQIGTEMFYLMSLV
jgi:arsenate reductase